VRRLDPARLANELVSNAVWRNTLHSPTEAMLRSFEQAAAFALVAEERLHRQVQAGQCMTNPQAWFVDFWGKHDASVEREHADRLCTGCPVRGQCLALDYIAAKGRPGFLHGVWGGLGPLDRRQLQPLWTQLVALLRAQPGVAQSWRTRPLKNRSTTKGNR
jgi:hypothetical protein